MFFWLLNNIHVYDPLPNTFQIGPVEVYFYSLFIVAGVIIALWLGLREGPKIGISKDHIIDGLLIILPLSIIGTRLWYVAFEWDQFSHDPVSIFAFWRDGFRGLAIHGGFVTAFVSTLIYTKVRGINFFRGIDLMAPGFLIAQALGRWGNFFNQEAHGGVIGGLTNGSAALGLDEQRAFLSGTLRLPDFITDQMFFTARMSPYSALGNQYFHPTFLYESLWNILGFIIMLVLRRTRLIRTGDLVAFYLIWYSVGRFFIEFLRTDALFIGDTGLRAAQVTSIAMIVAGSVFFVLNHLVWKNKHYHLVLQENKA